MSELCFPSSLAHCRPNIIADQRCHVQPVVRACIRKCRNVTRPAKRPQHRFRATLRPATLPRVIVSTPHIRIPVHPHPADPAHSFDKQALQLEKRFACSSLRGFRHCCVNNRAIHRNGESPFMMQLPSPPESAVGEPHATAQVSMNTWRTTAYVCAAGNPAGARDYAAAGELWNPLQVAALRLVLPAPPPPCHHCFCALL